jgi:hypothetical protein
MQSTDLGQHLTVQAVVGQHQRTSVFGLFRVTVVCQVALGLGVHPQLGVAVADDLPSGPEMVNVGVRHDHPDSLDSDLPHAANASGQHTRPGPVPVALGVHTAHARSIAARLARKR